MNTRNVQSNSPSSVLVDIQEVPDPYRNIFAAYPSFNGVQSYVFHHVFYTDNSIALSAPTGSGKTVIFELAIVRQLIAIENSKYSKIFKIVYISPMKALCEERLIDWHKKFSPYGVNCISITGDSDFIDFQNLSNHSLIITTPEKWDSITRKWKENKRFIQSVKLFMIDEVHLLNEENRGATLEVLVCRMKRIQSSIFDDNGEGGIYLKQNIRFLAASATFSNIKDVGEWLCGAKYFSFDANIRPVKLNTIVLGYSYSRSCTPFKFDITLNYKLPGLILKYSNRKPTLIFCSTRKSVEMAAKQLTQNLTIPLNAIQKEALNKASLSITDTKLKSIIVHGIGYHHGGLLPETRAVIEQLFRAGGLPVLITTSTLATGVNLPAHLVIIKSTKFYDKGGFQDYTATALLQMLGRAGRPQFDTEATALILTSNVDREKFSKMIDGKQDIESNLHRHLTEHLNAEIVLRTITDLDVAMSWLSSTFLYIRARENPRHYGLPLGLTSEKIDKKLLEVFQIDLNKLVKAEMASMDEDANIHPTFLGALMAKYYLSFETIKLFKTVNGNEILQQILALISKCQEFSDMRLRVDEKKCLNLLNKNKNKNSIRFPFNGKIKTLDMKINCTIQAIFGCLEIEDHSILSEAFRIMRLGERICRCLIDYLETRNNCYSALLNSIILWKCFRAQLWENSPHVAKQFSGIGLVTSNQLVNAGKTSLEKIINTNPRDLEMIAKKKPPFGNKMKDIAQTFPRYDVKHEKLMENKELLLKITITFLNPESLENSTVVTANSVMCLLVGNNSNNILLYERYMHSYMLENTQVIRFVSIGNNSSSQSTEIFIHFISEDIVGIDLNDTFFIQNQMVNTAHEKKVQCQTEMKTTKVNDNSAYKKLDSKYSNYVQTYMDNYLKCRKSNSKQIDHQFMTPNSKHNLSIKNSDNADADSSNGPNSRKICNTSDKKNVQKNGKDLVKTDDKSVTSKHSFHQKAVDANDNFYSLSTFEKSYTTPACDSERAEDSLEQEDATAVESFIDEDIPDHIISMMDQIENNEDAAKENNEHTNADDEVAKNPENLLKTDFLDSVVENECSKIFAKYAMNERTPETIEDHKISKNLKGTSGLNKTGNHSTNNCSSQNQPLFLKKGKIHSAKSFENSIFDPKSNSLNQFRHQPNKRFTHDAKEIAPPSAPQSKRLKLETSNDEVSEDMMKNLDKYIESNGKSIKWRSPLVYSPPVKFSPKISTSFSFSIPMPKNNDSETSHDWSSNTLDTSLSSRNHKTSTMGATPKSQKNHPLLKTQIRGTKFLLADKEYDKNKDEETNYSYNSLNQSQNTSVMQTPNRSLQFHDICSSSFLEDIGVAKTPKTTSEGRCFSQNPNTKPKAVLNAGTYYHELIARHPKIQNNAVSSPQIPQGKKPFFLQENEAYSPENDLSSSISSRNYERNSEISKVNLIPPFFQRGVRSSQTTLEPIKRNSNQSIMSSCNLATQYQDSSYTAINHPQYINTPPNVGLHSENNNLEFNELNATHANNLYRHFPPNTRGFCEMVPSSSQPFSNNQEMIGFCPGLCCRRQLHDTIGPNPHYSIQGMNSHSSSALFNADMHSDRHRLPLKPIPQNSSSTQNRTIERNFYSQDKFEVPKTYSSNIEDIDTYERMQTNLKSSKSFGNENENCNIQMSTDSNNINTPIQGSSTLPHEASSFYLNQDQFPSYYQGNLPQTFPGWKNICTIHRLFNCSICLPQLFALSQCLKPTFSRNYPSRNYNENSHIIAQEINQAHQLNQNFAPSSDNKLLFQRNQEGANSEKFYGFNHLSPDPLHPIPSKFQHFTNSNRQDSFLDLAETSYKENPYILNKTNFASQPSAVKEISESQMFPRETNMFNQIHNQQNYGVQPQNNSFLLNKFLNSFENNSSKVNPK